jgi:hypothetical protein
MPYVRITPSQFTITGGCRPGPCMAQAWITVPLADMTQNASPPDTAAPTAERRPLPPAAQRALAEAEARRLAAKADVRPAAPEFQGPKGPEPTRYGDWENKGIASDF